MEPPGEGEQKSPLLAFLVRHVDKAAQRGAWGGQWDFLVIRGGPGLPDPAVRPALRGPTQALCAGSQLKEEGW